MSTDMRPINTENREKISLTRFAGHGGVNVQITQRNLDELPFHQYVQVTKEEALQLAQALLEFVNDDIRREIDYPTDPFVLTLAESE